MAMQLDPAGGERKGVPWERKSRGPGPPSTFCYRIEIKILVQLIRRWGDSTPCTPYEAGDDFTSGYLEKDVGLPSQAHLCDDIDVLKVAPLQALGPCPPREGV